MSSSFNPPSGDSLAEVDVADVAYDDRLSVVEGVVSPRSQAGWAGEGEAYDVHCFSLAAWRRPGEPLVERKLTLLRPVPPARAGQQREESIFDRFPAYSIQRLSVLLSKDQTRAVVESGMTIDRPDEVLLAFSNRLRQPVVLSTEQFGDLVLDPKFGWFEAQPKWNGTTIDVHFEKSADGAIEDAIKTAERLWSDQAAWKRKVDEFAVNRLLPLKNKSWLEDDEAELTPKEFKARIKLVTINVAANGQFEFWHNDGQLFCGHAIRVRGNLQDGLTDARIVG